MKNNKIKILDLTVDLSLPNAPNLLLHNLETIGFSGLINHGVSLNLLEDMLQQWSIYFSDQKKYTWLRKDETDEGFIPLNVEIAQNGLQPDFKELYQAHYKNPLPDILNTTSTEKIFSELVTLGEKLCGFLDKELPSSVKEKMMMPLSQMTANSNNHLLRIIHYPPIEKKSNATRSYKHTDICLLTFVFGSLFSGLEFVNSNEELHAPAVNDNMLVVFNSDMIECATNGHLKSAVHQVKANSNSHDKNRYSVIAAIHPDRNIELTKGRTAGEYLKERLNEMGYNGNKLSTKNN